jgi:hypothetical protein
VPDQSQGRWAKCQHCNALFKVQNGKPASGGAFAADHGGTSPATSGRPRSFFWPFLLGLVAGGALILGARAGWRWLKAWNADQATKTSHAATETVKKTTSGQETSTNPQKEAASPNKKSSEIEARTDHGNKAQPADNNSRPKNPSEHGKPSKKEDAAVPAISPGPILVSTKVLQDLRKKAASNTPQWRAFKSRLDWQLADVVQDCYQGTQLTWISDYALGYLILKESDLETASKYADKAIAFFKSALHDYQKGGWVSRQFLARGDGTTRTFTLPHGDVVPSSLRVYQAGVWTKKIARGAAHSQDAVDYYQIFLKVSNTEDGPADYREGRDWRHNANLANNLIDWSLGGKEPTVGATYYVTLTSGFGAKNIQYALKGDTITLASAPHKYQAVFVEYVYGKHAADHSRLAYQQTSAGDGGFNSILIDTTYPSRYLGKHVAMGLDWLDGYAGLRPGLKKEAMDLLVRWSDHVRDKGYYNYSPASNYGAGGYVSRVMTALALAKRHAAGPRLVKEVIAYRKDHLLPVLEDKRGSLRGGFWAEGWSYGKLGTENILLAGLALEKQGLIRTAAAERHWASDVIRHLVNAQSSMHTVYDGGDWFAYPAPFPGKDFFYLLAAASEDTAARSYANYVIQKYPGAGSADYRDLLFHDLAAPASFWSALPLQHFASGTGLLTAHSDWGSSPTWVAFQLEYLLAADHQSYSPGQLQIKRGDDDLLINGNAPGKNQDFVRKSTNGNLIVIDDNGDGLQTYRYSMGVWYGEKAGPIINAYEAGKGHVYIAGDYHAAYSHNSKPGAGGPARELTRQVVYIRPDYLFVYDRVTTVKASYAKQQRWHFLYAPDVTDTAFVAGAGKSKLFGRTFAAIPLKATHAPVKVGSGTVHQLVIENAKPVQKLRYVSVLQVASSAAKSMANAEHIRTGDSRMEGARLGGHVVLFGVDGTVDLKKPVTYELNGKGTVNHLLVNLPAGQKCMVKADGKAIAVVTVTPQGTLAFTTSPDGKQTIEVARAP